MLNKIHIIISFNYTDEINHTNYHQLIYFPHLIKIKNILYIYIYIYTSPYTKNLTFRPGQDIRTTGFTSVLLITRI
ncbi:hypothetical protein RCL_jg26289.t1 [Rhizophagus clarus]|uniref:Uncharacterized protein n=1 Tax=Rhizophagus clarus TaxID=94130 RepID=A0A8H3L0B2_9GLOM|nr:hypothetical protein RCL_jg26289.t1 [Rhizophagus clarus]